MAKDAEAEADHGSTVWDRHALDRAFDKRQAKRTMTAMSGKSLFSQS
ncbi:hypothetical protein [Rhizobium mesosinicum]|uniref:Uncharacterized protein n=1 Tax=Rhizobium mesosinicum TaxID=335017 RepID=A0ABS7GS24_9HYPH|nr:hypothetical protein [Rhizobium mesosinicum]MBW9052165.1 hypothetical protein [Rhizobium mesosinicum]